MLKSALSRLSSFYAQLTGNAAPLPAEENATSDLPETQLPPPVSPASPAIPSPNASIILSPHDEIERLPRENLSPRAGRLLHGERNMDQIIRGLFLGDITAAHDRETLKELGITHVVTALDLMGPPHPEHFECLHLELEDTPFEDISRHFDDVFEFIDTARSRGGKVLVHCYAGISRSSTLTTYYIARKFDVDPHKALEFVREKRPEVEPNFGFWRQVGEAFGRRKEAGKW